MIESKSQNQRNYFQKIIIKFLNLLYYLKSLNQCFVFFSLWRWILKERLICLSYGVVPIMSSQRKASVSELKKSREHFRSLCNAPEVSLCVLLYTENKIVGLSSHIVFYIVCHILVSFDFRKFDSHRVIEYFILVMRTRL